MLKIDLIRGRHVDGRHFVVTERLYKTADGRIVREGDEDAAYLYASPGKTIPRTEAEMHGLVEKPKPPPKPAAKQAQKPADKSRRLGRNKQRGNAASK